MAPAEQEDREVRIVNRVVPGFGPEKVACPLDDVVEVVVLAFATPAAVATCARAPRPVRLYRFSRGELLGRPAVDPRRTAGHAKHQRHPLKLAERLLHV